jgi:hypothetical protein
VSLSSMRTWCLGTLTFAAMASIAAAPGNALSLKECSAKYRAAQSSGTTGGMSWQDFRKANCGASAYAPAQPTPAPAASNAAFPNAVAPKYAKESPGKARMHTCLDQYKTNKATNANGGLRWITKGGGYYSECNKRLKS